ncbi:MAG: oligosaccharide flippase family protein [Candidatus Aminicenantales bacterium]
MTVISSFRSSQSNLRSISSKIWGSSFVKNLFIVMSGTALAQILGFALSPLISRLYSPSDFGVFGSFYAVVSIIAAGLTLDYSLAIMLPKNKDDAINLFALSCISTAIISAICLVICLLAPGYVQRLIKAPKSWILILLILAILGDGLNQACQAWCVRVKSFKHTSASQVIRSISTNGTQLGLGYLKGGSSALVFAAVLGDTLASANLARVVSRDLRLLRDKIRWKRIWQLAKEYHDFPVYSASTNLINTLSLGLPIFLLTHFFGIAIAGAYAFGVRILSAPMGLVQRALKQVLYQKACETHNAGGRLLLLYLKFTAGLFALGLFPSLVFIIWAPKIFTWVFGAQWHTAGIFARSLILWLLFAFCNLPADLCARIARMQRKTFLYNLALLVLRTLALIVGGLYLSASYTVMLFSIVGAIMNVIFILIIGFALKKREGETAWKEILADLGEG